MSDARRAGPRLAAWLTLTVVSWIHLGSLAPWHRDAHLGAYGDALSYWRMMEQPWAAVDNPFALRILTPALVRAVHQVTQISPDTVWLMVTFVATVAAVVVFFELLWSHFRLSLLTALLVAVVLASTYWWALYGFGNPWLVDPINNLVVIVALWLLLRQPNWGGLAAFTVLLTAASVNKETALLLMPLWPALAYARTRSVRDRHVLAGSGATFAATAAYLGYRTWAVGQIGGDFELGAAAHASLIDNVRFSLSSNGDSDQFAIWSLIGGLWVIWAYGVHQLVRAHGWAHPLVVSSAWLLGCCLAGRVVATDTQRVFAMAIPLLLVVVALQLDQYRSEAQRLWLLMLGAVHVAVQLGWARSVWVDLAPAVVFAGLVTAVAIGSRRWPMAAGANGSPAPAPRVPAAADR